MGNVVSVPIKFQGNWQTRNSASENNFQIPADKLSSLLVYTDKAGKHHVEVLTSIPDNNYSSESNVPFSGLEIVQDWQGNYLKGFKLDSDKIYSFSFDDSASIDSVGSNQVRSNLQEGAALTICDYIDWYSCTDEAGCSFMFTQSLGCHTYIFEGGGGTGGTPSMNATDYAYVTAAHPTITPGLPWTVQQTLPKSAAVTLGLLLETHGTQNSMQWVFQWLAQDQIQERF
jgi:hypothetical protein